MDPIGRAALSGLARSSERILRHANAIAGFGLHPPGAGGQDLATSLVQLRVDSTAYKANLKTLEVSGELFTSLLAIGRN